MAIYDTKLMNALKETFLVSSVIHWQTTKSCSCRKKMVPFQMCWTLRLWEAMLVLQQLKCSLKHKFDLPHSSLAFLPSNVLDFRWVKSCFKKCQLRIARQFPYFYLESCQELKMPFLLMASVLYRENSKLQTAC